MRSCSPTPIPILCLTPCLHVLLGRQAKGRQDLPSWWATSDLASSMERRHRSWLPAWLPIRCHASLRFAPFSGCGRPTKKARILCEARVLFLQLPPPSRSSHGGWMGVASHPGSVTSGKHLQNNQPSQQVAPGECSISRLKFGGCCHPPPVLAQK